ncbi:alkane hydroxylase MAH1-like [Andrographis paniculata]|uniref:alkane hydroxylase MAH1-like n=1 Tax=Andrographis paniculata TaxID=175694 RepID=UPI0021E8A8D5|nr:alkane hydroxylase MAH1-like [Andrographis paniculata]
MAMLQYPQIFFVLILFTAISIYLWKRRMLRSKQTSSPPTNWPVVGMLPAILQNKHHLHAYLTQILLGHGGTFQFRGVWFSNTDLLFTCDPNNFHHIFTKNFPNYPKGPSFKTIFSDLLGDGVFNADFQLWELHRRQTMSFLKGERFDGLLDEIVWNKIETSLLPVLDHFSGRGIEFDLQDVFQRFAYDTVCELVLGRDPVSLSIALPNVPSEKALNDAIEPLLYRHFLPETVWKMQRWLRIGNEKKLMDAAEALDKFVYPIVDSRMNSEGNDGFDLITSFKTVYEEMIGRNRADRTRVFLRDTVVNLLFAGRDTTSTTLTWLFWLIATNPRSISRIREEVESVIKLKDSKNSRLFGAEESRKLVYLHGALCESLRLYPPVALQHKAALRPDVLPSGHFLRPGSRVSVAFYSMARMESLWGKDCLEFKPERWISGHGAIEHVPSYKFAAFSAGPRTCLGKDMSFVEMKMIAASIIHRYDVDLVKDHPVIPRDSVVLQTKHGLRVRLIKR